MQVWAVGRVCIKIFQLPIFLSFFLLFFFFSLTYFKLTSGIPSSFKLRIHLLFCINGRKESIVFEPILFIILVRPFFSVLVSGSLVGYIFLPTLYIFFVNIINIKKSFKKNLNKCKQNFCKPKLKKRLDSFYSCFVD